MEIKTPENTRQDNNYEQILMNSIDEAFSTLGETAKKAIYHHLEHKFKIKKQDIPNNIEAFSSALELVFGLGAKHLEILIMKKLHEKVGHQGNSKTPSTDMTFGEYVLLMKRVYKEKNP